MYYQKLYKKIITYKMDETTMENFPLTFKKKFIKLALIFFLIPQKTSAHRDKGQGCLSGHELT